MIFTIPYSGTDLWFKYALNNRYFLQMDTLDFVSFIGEHDFKEQASVSEKLHVVAMLRVSWGKKTP